MWKLKEPVKIVLKKKGVVITTKTLEDDPTLALLVLDDPDLKKKYGHNFIEAKERVHVSTDTIPVNLKKKADSVQPTLKPTVLTSTEVQTDGMSLNVKDSKQESKSQDSQVSKQGTGNQSSQKRK